MPIHMIYAHAANGVIGCDNALPWHLPEDLAHFKRLTWGAAVVMGRKTWQGLPVRPLPGRCNIVVSRHWCAPCPDPAQETAADTQLWHARSLAQALEMGSQARAQVWVMGGAQIYAQAQALVDTVHVTEIEGAWAGDAHAPVLDDCWREVARARHISRTGLASSLVRLERA